MRLLLILVVLSGSRSLQLPNLRLIDRCPSSYKIQTPSGRTVLIEVRDNANACDRIPELSERKDVETVSDLSPSMTLGLYGDRRIVNITWTPPVKGNKLPRMILLEFTKYLNNEETSSISACVLLRIKNRKLENNKAPPTLYFDCVELVEEKDVYLGVQVWCLPNSASVTKSCQTRHKRSLPPTRTCQKIMGKVICSENKLFHLSLDYHMPGICHCSDRPNLAMTRLENGSFKLDSWNLPQYAYAVRFYILRGIKEVFTLEMNGTSAPNERRSAITDIKFGPGNYTLVVSAACAGGMENIRRSGRNCPTMDDVQLAYPIEVPDPPARQYSEFQPTINTLLPVLGATILSCAITLLVFCIRRKWKQDQDSAPIEIEMERLSTRNNDLVTDEDAVLALAGEKSEKMLVYHPDNELHKQCIQQLIHIAQDVGLVLDSESTTDIKLHSDPELCSEIADLRIHFDSDSSEIDCAKENDTDVNMEMDVSEHPVLCLNWRDFAEMAGTEYTEIVIVVSPGLLNICRAFRNKSADQVQFNELRRERHYEIIPCVVFQKLQTLIQENPRTDTFSVHFVSFQPDCDLMKEFLDTFHFLKRCSNLFVYCLCKLNSNEESGFSLSLNETELFLLLRRLKGLAENEEGASAIQTVLSNGNNMNGFTRSLCQYSLYDIGPTTTV